MNDLPERLRYARLSAKLTLEELSRKSGISQATLQRYETGKSNPSIDKLLILAKTLKRSMDWLIGCVDPMNKDFYDIESKFIASKIHSYNNKISFEKEKYITSIISNICTLDELELRFLDTMIKGIAPKTTKDD